MLLAPAVLQFFLQAMQSVSQSIDSLPAGTQEPPDLLRLTVQNICKAAADAVTWGAEGCYCCDTNRKGYAQQRKQLMQSAHCLQATCLLMLITTYSTLPPLQDVNSSSRLSDMPAGLWRSCLCTKTPLPVPEGWPYAVRHHGALPMPHTEMLRLLGCSSKVCMWAAAILMPPDKEHLLLCAGRLHVELAKGVVDRDARLSSIFQGPAAQQPQPHTRQQQRQGVLTTADALHTLVPCVMLHWVAKYPVGTPDLLYCGIVTFVWSGAISGVSPISIQYEEMSRQQQQQHVLPAGFVAGSMVSVQQLLREQLAEALQAMQTLVSVWQGSINTAAASSSRTAVAGPPITDGLADAAAGMVNALKTLAQVLFNDSKLRDMEATRQGQLETNRLAPQHAKLAAAALRSQAVQLCLGLEHFVRVQAVAAAAPTTLATLRGVGEQDNWPRDGQLMLDTTNPVNCLAMEELLLVALHEGPGSKAQNHLLSLLASILKGCQTQQNQKHVLSGQFAACFVADEVLSGMQCKGLSAFAAAAAGSSSWEQAASSTGSTGKRPLVELALPWLALFGRCCLQWAQDLKQPRRSPAASNWLMDRMTQLMGPIHYMLDAVGISTTAELFLRGPATGVMFEGSAASLMQNLIWLQSANMAAHTRAAGVDLQPLMTQLQVVLAAAAAAPVKGNTPAQAAYLAGFAPKLEALGLALCSVPNRELCNNPHCRELSGPSDLHLVTGRKQCSGCKFARYCCKVCSAGHWKQHKPICQAVAAAAAAVQS